MKQRIKEIIAYIMDLRTEGLADLGLMNHELEDLGYSSDEIDQALRILDFDSGSDGGSRLSPLHVVNRILGEGEKIFLSTAAQGYLIRLQSSGWLSETQLSLIIENAPAEYQIPVSAEEIMDLTSRFVPEIPEEVLRGAGGDSNSLN
ncbi:MAG TPA: DUF494 family protein [Candidatus Krumholzibacterium sp.]|nr:DUF494 family protein [Candidatus Krumholzibacterium sp.]